MSNHNGNNKINKSNNVKWRNITNLATRPYIFDSSQEEVQHVGHVLILLGAVSLSGGAWREIRPIFGPCYCNLELLWRCSEEKSGQSPEVLWSPGPADVECIDKNYRSVAPDPCGWPPAGQPHVIYNVPTSAGEQRWTPKVAVVRPHLPAAGRPQAVVVPGLVAPAGGVQYFSMKSLLIGGRMTLLGAMSTL